MEAVHRAIVDREKVKETSRVTNRLMRIETLVTTVSLHVAINVIIVIIVVVTPTVTATIAIIACVVLSVFNGPQAPHADRVLLPRKGGVEAVVMLGKGWLRTLV